MKRYWIMVCTVLALLSMVAVATAQDGDDGHGGSMVMGLPTVGPEVTIRFAATVGDVPATCGMIYEGVGVSGSTISVNDLRFYVSNVRLINAAGEEVPVELTQDGQWQYANVALIDFEDGTSLCSDVGNTNVNTKVVGTVPEGEYHGLVFDVGVPFELNHLDTTTAPAPLNIPAMWWNWQGGYKFVRIDLQTPHGTTPGWFAHIGSTGCSSADTNTPPAEPCSNPNIATIRLASFDPVRNFVVADIASLFATSDLDAGVAMPPGCMAGIEDPDCVGFFAGFGLDLATGMMIDGLEQSFFHAG